MALAPRPNANIVAKPPAAIIKERRGSLLGGILENRKCVMSFVLLSLPHGLATRRSSCPNAHDTRRRVVAHRKSRPTTARLSSGRWISEDKDRGECGARPEQGARDIPASRQGHRQLRSARVKSQPYQCSKPSTPRPEHRSCFHRSPCRGPWAVCRSRKSSPSSRSSTT